MSSSRRPHNDRVLPGQALITPGGRRTVPKRCGMQYHVDIVAGSPLDRIPAAPVGFSRDGAR